MTNKRGLVSKITSIVVAFSLVFCAEIILDANNAYGAEFATDISSILLSEDNFSTNMQTARNVTNANKQTGYFKGVDDVNIYYETHIVENAKGTIAMSPGYTENAYSYEELMYYFNSMGYSTCILEHRGMSRSGRLSKTDQYQIYVKDFDDYIEDFKTFVDTIVKPSSNGTDLYLFSHSMGGLVATRYLQKYAKDKVFKKAVLSAPMLGINTGNIPSWLADIVSVLANGVFLGEKYVAGQGPGDVVGDFATATGCTSEARYNELTAGPRINNPELKCGGASYKWLFESFREISKTFLAINIGKIKTPILMFQAGDDAFVDNGNEEKFVKKMKTWNKDVPCSLIKFSQSRHEIYKSTNNDLQNYLTDIFDFYE